MQKECQVSAKTFIAVRTAILPRKCTPPAGAASQNRTPFFRKCIFNQTSVKKEGAKRP
jgi:hypothetical protein